MAAAGASALMGVLRGLGVGARTATAIDTGVNAAGQIGFATQAIKGLVRSVTDAVNPLASFTTGVNLLASSFSGVAAAASPLSYLNVAVGALADTAKAAVGHVTAIGNSIKSFVDLANPAYSQLFEFAERDLIASFGRGLIPVMEFATKTTRGFADVIYRLSGPAAKLMSAVFGPLGDAAPRVVNAMTPMIDSLGRMILMFAAIAKPISSLVTAGIEGAVYLMADAFRTLDVVLGPTIRLVTDLARAMGDLAHSPLGGLLLAAAGMRVATIGATLVAPIVGVVGLMLMSLAPLAGAVAGLAAWFGFRSRGGAIGADGAAGGSTGAAITRTDYGSVDSYLIENWKRAFMLSAGSASPEERAAATLVDIAAILRDIRAANPELARRWDEIRARPEVAEGDGRGWADELRDAVEDPAAAFERWFR